MKTRLGFVSNSSSSSFVLISTRSLSDIKSAILSNHSMSKRRQKFIQNLKACTIDDIKPVIERYIYDAIDLLGNTIVNPKSVGWCFGKFMHISEAYKETYIKINSPLHKFKPSKDITRKISSMTTEDNRKYYVYDIQKDPEIVSAVKIQVDSIADSMKSEYTERIISSVKDGLLEAIETYWDSVRDPDSVSKHTLFTTNKQTYRLLYETGVLA